MVLRENDKGESLKEHVFDLLSAYVDSDVLARAPLTSRLQQDLGVDNIDFLYIFADLEDRFGVPMCVRSTHQGETLQGILDLVRATLPDVEWEREIGGEG